MRTWRPDQQHRLAQESGLLRRFMPDFSIYDPLGETNVSGYWTSNSGPTYLIRIFIPEGYPDTCPSSYVDQPSPLLDHSGRPIIRHGSSNKYHTWETDRAGCVKLCTFNPEFWDASNTLIQMIQKSFLWITAYEFHVNTGTRISKILLHMQNR